MNDDKPEPLLIEPEAVVDPFIRPPSPVVRAFTRYFIEQGFENASEAARRAGTSAKNPNHIAYQWLQDPWVKQEIKRAKELIDRGENPLELIREEDVIAKLTTVYEQALSHQRYEPALKAVELMGKHIGMFTDAKKSLEGKLIHKRMEQEENIQNLKELKSILIPKSTTPASTPPAGEL